MRDRRSVGIPAAGVAALALALAACLPSLEQVSPDDSTPWPGAQPQPSWSGDYSALPAYQQDVDWSPCGGLECATILVPLDWTDPTGSTIEIAINRSPARDPEHRIGSLLINPGGPGGSGLDITSYFVGGIAGDDVLDAFDIVGFDPRGVGESSPVDCGTDAELDAYFLSDDVIETQDDLNAARETTAAFAQRCRERTGPLVENVDTTSVARDMDVIRALLGDDELYYLGFSYGTQLGVVYATLYPDHVGRMVLDGVLDFLLPSEDISLGQAAGFEGALDAYLEDCVASAGCPLGRDVEEAKRTIIDIMDEARDFGYPTGNVDVNGTILVYGIAAPLYDPTAWSVLTDAFAEVLDRGTARIFLDLADWYLERSSTGKWETNGQEAWMAISCLDAPEEPLLTISQFRAFRDEAIDESPTFGWWFGAGAGCEGWPWTAKDPVFDITAAGTAAPIVAIGTTGDPATPIQWAESIADQLPNASLLVYNGEGHTAYSKDNTCIASYVDDYLVDGTVPVSGTTC